MQDWSHLAGETVRYFYTGTDFVLIPELKTPSQ